MAQPLVSVIMPARDVAPYVRDALGSLARQTLADFEVLVVDDASRDGTGRIVRAHAARDPRFRVLAGEGAGVSAARNQGLATSRGRYVAFLDADDMAPPDSLALRVGLLREASLVSCGWDVIGPDGAPLGLAMGRIKGPRRFDTAFDPPVHIGAMMGEGDLLRSLRFDEARTHGEDHHYLLSLLRAGVTLHTHPEPALLYRWREGSAASALVAHQTALVDLLDTFAAPAAGEGVAPEFAAGWKKASVRPRQLWLLYDLAVRLVMSGGDAEDVEAAAQRCDALLAYGDAAPADYDVDSFWVAAVRTFLAPRQSAELSRSACACVGGLLALADRLAAHEGIAANLRAFVDAALARTAA